MIDVNGFQQTALDYAEPAQRALLVDGIRPILPLIRNTPYGKRIQSKLQREQMEMSHTNGISQYGNGGGFNHHSQQHQLMGMGMAGQGLSTGHHATMGRHVSQPNLRQANQLGDLYDPRTTMYALQQQNGARMPQQALHMHGQQMHPQGIDSYVLQQGSGMGAAANGFGTVGGFASGMPVANFGASMPLTGTINDPYQQHSYGYGM